MYGLRLSKLRACLPLVLLVAALAVPALADTTAPAAAAPAAQTGDPIVKKAMMTLPDAMAKWRLCYTGCMEPGQCSPSDCASDCEQQVVAMGYAASQTSEMLRYNVMGIYGADCIGDFRKYIQTIQDAAKKAHSLGLSLGNILASVIVDKILDAVIGQILGNLTNQICNVSNQITQAAESFVQNAICVPNININPFNFNLNIQELQCSGFSVNPLTGQINGSPINGVSVPINNIYNSGTNPTAGTGLNVNPLGAPLEIKTAPLPLVQVPTIADPVTVPAPATKGGER